MKKVKGSVKHLLIINLMLLNVLGAGSAHASLEDQFQARRRQLEEKQWRAAWEGYTQLAYGWASMYGQDVTIVKPKNFGIHRYGTYYVQLSNGLKCRVIISELDNMGGNFSRMDCLR